jgi:DNA (cytosine-5)-methyltransferase 1
VSKKNSLGRAHGLECKTQGTLFFDICRIIREKRPKAFLLENVKNLKSHDKGNTFRVITEALQELGYQISLRVIDGRHWVPQHRERIFIIGWREQTDFSLDQLAIPTASLKLRDILQQPNEPEEEPYTTRINSKTVVSL